MNKVSDRIFALFLEHGSVSTDSRQISPGSLFFALRGERFDGNAFAKQALEQGAAYAIVSDPSLHGELFIAVPDTLKALQDLATRYRKTCGIPVVAITGSNGKTTTKELLSTVLGAEYRTHITRGNLNNHIGVPLTLLEMPQSTEMAVVEMGANHVGEIAALCKIARPTHGVITNIGEAHLEGFGDLEGVKRGKSELYHFLAAHGGTAFVNDRLDDLGKLSSRVQKRIFYGIREEPAYNPQKMQFAEVADAGALRLRFVDPSGAEWTVRSTMFGAYNAGNLATAIAIGLHFHIGGQDIAGRLSAYSPQNNRSQRLEIGDLTVILDAYNANPTSMKEALESFAKLDGAKNVVLGDMRELGAHAEAGHATIIASLQGYQLDGVYLVGPHFMEAEKPSDYRAFKDIDTLCRHLSAQPALTGNLLIKGSRAIQLERLLTVLQ